MLVLDIFAGDVGVGGEGGLEMKVFEGSLSVGMSFVFDRGGGLDGRSVVLEARKSLAIVQGRCRRRLFVCLAFTGSALNFVTGKVGSMPAWWGYTYRTVFNRNTFDLEK